MTLCGWARLSAILLRSTSIDLVLILSIRDCADSIDLQDRDAPSAQDHNRLNTPSSKPAASSSLAPHQAETLREVAAETAEENLRSPRVSWANGDIGDLQQYAEDLAAGVADSLNGQTQTNGKDIKMAADRQQQDALAIAQNGGMSGNDASDDGDLDADADDGMDDDMMDKISSSPSIEDGGYTSDFPRTWPRRVDSLHPSASPCSSPTPASFTEARSSSPYLDLPEHLPLPLSTLQISSGFVESPSRHHHHHHLKGEYNRQYRTDRDENVSTRTNLEKADHDGTDEG